MLSNGREREKRDAPDASMRLHGPCPLAKRPGVCHRTFPAHPIHQVVASRSLAAIWHAPRTKAPPPPPHTHILISLSLPRRTPSLSLSFKSRHGGHGHGRRRRGRPFSPT